LFGALDLSLFCTGGLPSRDLLRDRPLAGGCVLFCLAVTLLPGRGFDDCASSFFSVTPTAPAKLTGFATEEVLSSVSLATLLSSALLDARLLFFFLGFSSVTGVDVEEAGVDVEDAGVNVEEAGMDVEEEVASVIGATSGASRSSDS